MDKLTRHSSNLGLIAALLLCTCMATTPAMAESITFNFTGYVHKVGEKLTDGTFSKGQSVAGSYTFNPDTPNNSADLTKGEYPGALNDSSNTYPSMNLHVTVGSPLSYEALLKSTDNEIEIKNPYNNFSDESYEVEGAFSGAKVSGYKPHSFEFELEHPTSDQFDDVLLHSTPPTISAFAERTLRLTFGYGGDDKTVTIKLQTLTAPVPLPPAVILFGAGLAALAGMRRLRNPT